ncbi:amidohydrolase family protein [Candidatus Spongiisocius sp.]|uniref:amidohydrolase family protein n=1 Tax=Candidatus Spongiisocius sp. TaxID=3101273 RepID=UPI003B5A64C5
MKVSTVRIQGVSWLDTSSGEHSERNILVRGGVLADPSSESADLTIDASGLTGMFGLWDCHAHVGGLMYDPDAQGYFEAPAARTIRAGVNLAQAARMGITGVRSVGECDDIDLVLSRAHEAGVPPGLRLRGSGCALKTTGGHGVAYPREFVRMKGAMTVDGPSEVARAVRHQVSRGAHWIKASLTGGLYSEHETVDGGQFSDEEIEALMRTAHQRGIPVAAHCGGSEEAMRFSRLGGRSVEHGYALDEQAAASMAKASTWLVPTIGVTHDSSFISEDGWPSHAANRAAASIQRHREGLEACLEAGVRIAVGADLNPIGPRLHREMELLEEVGLDRLTVLHAATIGGRELNGLGPESLPEPGAAADIVLTEGSPLDNPRVLRDPALVMAFGRVLKGEGTEHWAPSWQR